MSKDKSEVLPVFPVLDEFINTLVYHTPAALIDKVLSLMGEVMNLVIPKLTGIPGGRITLEWYNTHTGQILYLELIENKERVYWWKSNTDRQETELNTFLITILLPFLSAK